VFTSNEQFSVLKKRFLSKFVLKFILKNIVLFAQGLKYEIAKLKLFKVKKHHCLF